MSGEQQQQRSVDPKLVALLLEEACWSPYHGTDQPGTPPDERRKYLEESVFPTLVPALAELLTLVEAEETLKNEGKEPANKGPYGPTGEVHPTDWLAQYLMRNNVKERQPGGAGPSLKEHPYCALRTALAETQSSNNNNNNAAAASSAQNAAAQ